MMELTKGSYFGSALMTNALGIQASKMAAQPLPLNLAPSPTRQQKREAAASLI